MKVLNLVWNEAMKCDYITENFYIGDDNSPSVQQMKNIIVEEIGKVESDNVDIRKNVPNTAEAAVLYHKILELLFQNGYTPFEVPEVELVIG